MRYHLSGIGRPGFIQYELISIVSIHHSRRLMPDKMIMNSPKTFHDEVKR